MLLTHIYYLFIIINIYLFFYEDIMINLAPSAVDAFAESATEITSGISKNVPVIGNAAICADSVCTAGRAGINFYCSPNPIARVFFCTSCLCGLMGATSSGIALTTSFAGIPAAGWLGSFGARGFNRLGKYTLEMGKVTNGNSTNTTSIIELVTYSKP